jgi:hypothetical protein
MFGKSPAKPGEKTELRPSRTAKPAKQQEFPAPLFAMYSLSKNLPFPAVSRQKCKLLLHLGNSRAFSVDNKLGLK